MNSSHLHQHLNGGKSLTLGNHKPMYSSASAASSGSSSGHRSNHTQHSIVSVHGTQQGPPSSVVSTSGVPYDQYRPMISTFGGGGHHPHHHSIQEQSPSQIYNEPTGPTSYYATGALPDRPGTGNGGGGGSSGGSSGSANGNGSASTTFFSPPNSAAARFNHNTMRASLTAHHRLAYEQQQQQQQQGSSGVMTSVSVNPKF